MNGWLTLDFVARRYGTIPSIVLDKGSSVDILCANLGIQYENYLAETAKNGGKPANHGYSDEELINMINKAKKKDAIKS